MHAHHTTHHRNKHMFTLREAGLPARRASAHRARLPPPAVSSARFHALTASLFRVSNQTKLTVTLDTRALISLDAEGANFALINPSRLPQSLFDAPFSEGTVKARGKVLSIVLDNLNSRRASALEKDPRRPNHPNLHTDVSDSNSNTVVELVLESSAVVNFAGTLTLLLESGHLEQVVTSGMALLQSKKQGEPQPVGMQDVALCVAVAHQQLARKAPGLGAWSRGVRKKYDMSSIHDMAAWRSLQAGSTGSMSSSRAYIAEAYCHTCDGLKLLEEYCAAEGSSMVEDLRDQFMDMRQQLAPLHAQQLLAPDPASGQPASKQQREAAVQILRQVLWQMKGHRQRKALMAQIRPMLAAAEQIALYEDAPVPDALLSERELYDEALAHIWEGYTQRWPHHVYRADCLLALISQRTDLDLDVTLERNVCALLLGKGQEAQGQLVLAEGKAGSSLAVQGRERHLPTRPAEGLTRQEPQQLPFVVDSADGIQEDADGSSSSSSSSSSDVYLEHDMLQLGAADSAFVIMEGQRHLEALESWAERWLELSVMPGFQASTSGDTQKQPVSVRSYLSSPKVAVFNQVLRHANEQNLRHVKENLQSTSHEALQQLLGLWRSTNTLAQNVLQRPPKDQQQQQQAQQQGQPTQQQQQASDEQPSTTMGGQGMREDSEQVHAAGSSLSSSTIGSRESLLEPLLVPFQAGTTESAGAGASTAAAAAAGTPPAAAAADATAAGTASGDGAAWLLSDSSDEDMPVPGSLWVKGPRGIIQPRMSARIIDPRQGRMLPKQEQQAAAGGPPLMQGALKAGARVAAVAAVAAAAWFARRGPLPAGPAWAAEVAASDVQQRQGPGFGSDSGSGQAGRHQAGALVPLPSSRDAIAQMIRNSHLEAAGASLSAASARSLLLSWQAVSQAPGQSRQLLPLLLEGGALEGAQQEAAQQLKKQQQRRPSAAAVSVEVVSLQQEQGRAGEMVVRARMRGQLRSASGGASGGSLAGGTTCMVVNARLHHQANGRPEGPWRIAQLDIAASPGSGAQ